MFGPNFSNRRCRNGNTRPTPVTIEELTPDQMSDLQEITPQDVSGLVTDQVNALKARYIRLHPELDSRIPHAQAMRNLMAIVVETRGIEKTQRHQPRRRGKNPEPAPVN